jgi:hypothetical protein
LQRNKNILIGALLATVIFGCSRGPADKPLATTALERAALDEHALHKKPEVRTAQSQSLPRPMPSELLPAMTGPQPRGMDSDVIDMNRRTGEQVTRVLEEPEPPQTN